MATKESEKAKSSAKSARIATMQATLKALRLQFPKCFLSGRDVKPLKKGIINDIFAFNDLLDEPPFSRTQLRQALKYYTNSIDYLFNQTEGVARIDLHGQPAGSISKEDAEFALKKRHLYMAVLEQRKNNKS